MYRIRRCAEIFSAWPTSLSQSETLLGWAENFYKESKSNALGVLYKNIWNTYSVKFLK